MLTSPSSISPGEIDLFFKELNDFCFEQKSKKMVYFGIEEICNIAFAETYRAIIDFEFTNKQIRDLFISQIESIQSYSPAAAAYFPFMANQYYERNIDINHDDFLPYTEPGNLENINQIIESFFEYSSMLKGSDMKNIFKNNGFVSSFNIKKSNSFHNACVFDSGISIICNINSGFFKKKTNIEFANPQIIIYDGYIQEVSELNLILNKSHEDRVNFVIFVKGASIDVINTCFVNLNMNKCNVLLIEPEPSFWGETQESICKAFGITPHGYSTGKLLNTFEIEKDFDASITVKKNEAFVKSSLLDLDKSAKTSFFLNESSWLKRGMLTDQLNFFSSTLQQIATCGVIKNSNFLKETKININLCTGLENEYHPAFCVIRALKEAETIVSKIVNTGCVIRLEH